MPIEVQTIWNKIMQGPKNCNVCLKPIPIDAPHGICPSCAFGLLNPTAPKKPTEAQRTGLDGQAPLQVFDVAAAFPQLEILELLGTGGMGSVFKVRQRALDRIAALKILNPELGTQPQFQERFAREAKTMARLVHPNIAFIFEFGQAGPFYFLLLEFIDGVNLRAAIRNKTITADDALCIVPQLCDALQYAHGQGVIHRDIKPENILIDREGRVKLVDFGLAKLNTSNPGQPTLTGTQQILGTMNYMAPELWERPSQIDHRADIFSLGVVFYELLTGELPLGKFAPPSSKGGVDSRIDSIVMRTLEKDPGARYQSAGEVKTAVSTAGMGPRPMQPQVSSQTNEILASVAYTIGDNVNNWETNGLAILTRERLRLEFAKKSEWLGADEGIDFLDLRPNDIARVSLVNGPITKGLEVQTKSLSCLKDFPYLSERGILIRTVKKDNEIRDRLYVELCRLIGQPCPDFAAQATQVQQAKEKTRGPATGLFFTGLINILTASVIGAIALAPTLIGLPTFMQPPLIGAIAILPAAIGTFQLAGSFLLREIRQYAICLACCIVSIIPVTPAALIGIPSGIWGLTVLGDQLTFSAFERLSQTRLAPLGKP